MSVLKNSCAILAPLIVLTMNFSSCSDTQTASTEAENYVQDEQVLEKFSDETEKNAFQPEESKSQHLVQLNVKNELPFTGEIYQLLNALGTQLANRPGDLELVLDMRLTPSRKIQLNEYGSNEINASEEALWDHLKMAVSHLLLDSANSDAMIKIEYVRS
ncbi:MAG TPA: hypothetical protein VKA68_10800 [bacterium]|nr:hypothetical protein [bacterium]